ncbi:MAG: TetR/AcrR family transcriptional regulator [Eubacteriales bacterium]|nr:TetR/AcrR family transcriptional regulator [Eubacteriales bacterium]
MAKAEYRSAIRSRRLINTALADLLQEKPLDKITVTDVVNRAEINRGTFYAHYTDIPDVINHLIQQTFSNLREALSAPCQPLADVPKVFLFRIQKILEEDLDFYRKIMNSSASLLMQEQLVNIVLDYLFQREESFGFGDHEQFLLTMRFCAGGLSNLYRDWFAGKLSFSLDELTRRAENLLSSIMAGLSVSQG